MTEPAWTLGPWKSSPTYPAGQFVIHSQTAMGPGEHQMRTVARCKEKADGDLIAAAPALYEALVALLPEGWGADDTMDHMPGVKLARAALAKAEGRTS